MSSDELGQFPDQLPSESSGRKPRISQKKLEANRRNSLRSTGPKTARGKCIVSRNAIKHGILAREVLITSGEGQECQRELNELVDKLVEYYRPVGVVEEKLVETIAACWWRKARILRAENGEIRKRLDTGCVDYALRASDKANFDLSMMEMEIPLFNRDNRADESLSSIDQWSVMHRAAITLRGHGAGRAYLEALLHVAKDQITKERQLSLRIVQKLSLAFGFCDHVLVRSCIAVCPEGGDPGNNNNNEDKKVEDQLVELAVSIIDDRLKNLDTLDAYHVERAGRELQAEARRFALPPVEAVENLVRYETHIDRQLYRAMNQLERLQRMRGGENIPPPLNITV